MDKPAYGAHLVMVKCTGDSYCNAVQLLDVEPVRGKSGKKIEHMTCAPPK